MSPFAEWEFAPGSLNVIVDRAAAQPRRIVDRALARIPDVAIIIASAILVLAAQSSSAQNAPLGAGPRLELVKDVRPVYPEIAKAAGVQGLVKIEARVGPKGQVVDARIVRSIPLLDNAALDTVRQWEFVPPPSDRQFVATVHFVLSTAPISSNASPADAVGWPPSDFALYYRYECSDGLRQHGTGAFVDSSGQPFAVTTSVGAADHLSLLLVQEGFFQIPDAATERSQRAAMRVTDDGVDVTVAGQRPRTAYVTNTDGPPAPRSFHHELMVRTFGMWRILQWDEPVTVGDQRAAEASRIGVAVRRFFRSPQQKEDRPRECR